MREKLDMPVHPEAAGVAKIEAGPAEEGPENQEAEKTHNIDFYATTHMVDDPAHWDPQRFREHLQLLKAGGIDFLAYDWSWTRVNPRAGEFDQRQIECYKEAKKIMEEEGMKPPTVIFTVAPEYVKELYEGGDKEGFFRNYQDYITRVRKALIECGGQEVETFQIFNELNNKMYTFVEPKDIERMCLITDRVFRDYNPGLKLKATLVAGSLAETAAKFGKATGIMDFLKRNRAMLQHSFDEIAIDYYPGVWHWPLKEAGLKVSDFMFGRKKTKAIFQQTGLLEQVFRELASWKNIEYEIGEYGLPTNQPWSNEDKQRYAFDVFARALRRVLDKLWREGKRLPKRFGIYESSNRLPRNEDEIKTKKRTLNLWPEHDFGITQENGQAKEILRGRRHISAEQAKTWAEQTTGREPQLLRLKDYLNRPFEPRQGQDEQP